MTKDETKKARQSLKRWLVKHTKCQIQSGGWPCGTCTVHFLKQLGLDAKDKEYKAHNHPVDRLNEVWRAILQIRYKEV